MGTRNIRWMPARIVSVVMLFFSVSAVILILLNLTINSIPAVRYVGLKNLFSTQISSIYSGNYVPGQFGLLPAIWGTVLAAIVALAIAFPVSLAMAILASEFTLGGIGKLLEILLSLFAGIPPVVYALLSLVVAKWFMQLKFTGEGLSEQFIQTLPGLPEYNAGMLPREQSTLLGGVLLSLLIIPFMAPLMLDAFRNVDYYLKEASWALGGNQWYTLKRVTLPAAMAGIISAVSLGVLKASGDVIIVAWAIGFIKDNGMPVPLFDILERNAPLTSTAAGMLNAFQSQGNAVGLDGSVAYFAGLLLLLLAFAILALSSLLQKYLHRRFAQ